MADGVRRRHRRRPRRRPIRAGARAAFRRRNGSCLRVRARAATRAASRPGRRPGGSAAVPRAVLPLRPGLGRQASRPGPQLQRARLPSPRQQTPRRARPIRPLRVRPAIAKRRAEGRPGPPASTRGAGLIAGLARCPPPVATRPCHHGSGSRCKRGSTRPAAAPRHAAAKRATASAGTRARFVSRGAGPSPPGPPRRCRRSKPRESSSARRASPSGRPALRAHSVPAQAGPPVRRPPSTACGGDF